MPVSSSSDRDFLRFLQTAQVPLYLVDQRRQIVYLNDACVSWLEVSAAELIGRVCHYQSAAADRLAATADALCPPPEAMGGRRTRATVARLGQSGDVERRNAEFIPLPGESESATAVLAIVDSAILPAGDSGPEADEAQQLHDLVRRLRQEMAAWHQPQRLTGRSPAMARVRAQVSLAAAGRGTVLICGPAGCGAQQVARTIHVAQSGTAGSFMPVSCSALPGELFRSTIAGFMARRQEAGRESTATLLLDDVHKLPAEVQPELARWLADAAHNVRVMATSTQHLDELVDSGQFRPDLAMLLGTQVIELPPLAQRREDIPVVAQMLLEDLNGTGGKQLRGFSAEALDTLAAYDWPGDVDEMSAAVREAFSAARGFEVAAAELPKRLFLAEDARRHPRKQPQRIDLEKFLGQVEAELIGRALREAKGNKSQAARLLGLTRPRLYRRMVQLGLAGDEATHRDADEAEANE